MPPGRNGTARPAEAKAAVPGARQRYSAIPQTETFELEVLRPNEAGELVPTIVEVVGQHKDCHEVWVDVQMQAALQEYQSVVYVEETIPDPTDPAKTVTVNRYRYDPEAEARYRRDCLMVATKGLEERDADVLARDDGPWRDILASLGWWRAPDDAEAEADDDPEAVGEAGPTTAPSSPDSQSSTAPTTG